MRTAARLIVALALVMLTAPLVAEAQQPGTVPRIGVLLTGSPSAGAPYVDAFTRGLRELGHVEGQSVAIESRWVEERSDRFIDVAADLVRTKVDLIVVWGTTAATAAKRATSTVPIVFVAAGDPVGTGLLASLARPGGNITGITNISADMIGKLLELLKEVVPGVTRVAALRNPSNPVSAPQLAWTQSAARALGVQLQVIEVQDPKEFESGFAAMTRERADALIVLADPMFLSERNRIAYLAEKNRMPAVFNVRQYVEAGGLMAYGPSLVELFHRAATYVDKILKGAKPADLPVELPTKFELVVNLKTAKTLGLTIPQSILLQAVEVME
jgi:putative ABC transport system substrate-binding protein